MGNLGISHENMGNFSTVICSVQLSSVTHSCLTLWPHESQHTWPPCPSPTPTFYSNPGSSRRWGHPTISSSVLYFSSCPQLLPASGSLPMNQPFACGGSNIGVSGSASVLPKYFQEWFHLQWTGWISLHFKSLLTVFSNAKVQKHQFFHTQLSSQSISHIHKRQLEKP